MPAIRIKPNGIGGVLTSDPAHRTIPVRRTDGTWAPLEFIGFICPSGARALGYTNYAKLYAIEITSGNSMMAREWRNVHPGSGEYVCGVRFQRNAVFGYGNAWCVYALVDSDGWPMVRSDRGPVLNAAAGA